MPVQNDRIPTIIAALPGVMQSAVLALAEMAAERMHELCPKDTGSLDATIGVDQGSLTYDSARGARVVVCAGDISGGYSGRDSKSSGVVDYAIPVEFGGAHTPPQPFAGPAAQHVKAEGPSKAAAIIRTALI